MSSQPHQRRRRLFWYPGFQTSFVWGLGGAVLAVLMSSGFSLLILLMARNRPVLPDIFPVLIIFDLIILLAMGMIVYWMALFVSHRMGGPLHRMARLMEGLGQGRLDQRVSLRQGDQLQDIAQSLNQGVGGLRYRVERLRRGVQVLCETAPTPESQAEAQRLRQELDELFVV
ncbi:MAG: methyl-accepting chemotaxis protein [Desulfarculaceae bacterium]|nr:methyl-accepting chemotaxis protein [Desulfarculaceae bacterium]